MPSLLLSMPLIRLHPQPRYLYCYYCCSCSCCFDCVDDDDSLGSAQPLQWNNSRGKRYTIKLTFIYSYYYYHLSGENESKLATEEFSIQLNTHTHTHTFIQHTQKNNSSGKRVSTSVKHMAGSGYNAGNWATPKIVNENNDIIIIYINNIQWLTTHYKYHKGPLNMV